MTRSKITKEIIADMPEELREDVRRYGDAIVNAYRRGCSDTEQKLSITSIGSKQPTTQGIRAVATRYANNFQDLHKGELTTLDLRESFISGAEWYKSFTAAGVCSGSDKTT